MAPHVRFEEVVAQVLGRPDFEALVREGLLRITQFGDVLCISLRRDLGTLPCGAAIVVGRERSLVLQPCPKMVLAASLRHAAKLVEGRLVLEEYVPGACIRVAALDGVLVAVTEDGLICPYLTRRLQRLYGDAICRALEDAGTNSYLVGIVTGLENPYVRYYYPDSPRFEFLVTDVIAGGRLLPVAERTKLVERHGLKEVKVLGSCEARELEAALREALKTVEARGGAGLMVRSEDSASRVVLLTPHALLTKIKELLLSPSKGWKMIIDLLILDAIRLIHEGAKEAKRESRAFEIGLTLVDSLTELVQALTVKGRICEEFELRFGDDAELEEFVNHAAKEGLGLALLSKRIEGSEIVAVFERCFEDLQRLLKGVIDGGLTLR